MSGLAERVFLDLADPAVAAAHHNDWREATLRHYPGGPLFAWVGGFGWSCPDCGRPTDWVIPVHDLAEDRFLLLCQRCFRRDGGFKP